MTEPLPGRRRDGPPPRAAPGRDRGDGSSSASGRSSTPTTTTCCSSSTADPEAARRGCGAVRAGRGPRRISGKLRRHRPGAPSAPSSPRCTRSSTTPDAKAEDYIVYKIFDVLTDAFYLGHRGCSSCASTRSRAHILLGRAPTASSSREIYRLKQRVHELALRVIPQRNQLRQRRGHNMLNLPRPRARRRELPARRRRAYLAQITGELHRQQEDLTALTATYFSARAQNRLNAGRGPGSPSAARCSSSGRW